MCYRFAMLTSSSHVKTRVCVCVIYSSEHCIFSRQARNHIPNKYYSYFLDSLLDAVWMLLSTTHFLFLCELFFVFFPRESLYMH